MRNIWADGVNSNFHEEKDDEEDDEKVNNKNQGRELLKRASLLHKEFYVVNKIGNN